MLLLAPWWVFGASVIVSVAPHKFFVEQIAKDSVTVRVMVPASATPHSYEPPPKQILEASRADIWFRIGEGFEKKAIEAIEAHRKDFVVVDLRKGLSLILAHCDPHGDPYSNHHGDKCCCADGADLHIWLSLRLAQIQADTIAEALSQRYPEKAAFFAENLKAFKRTLIALDSDFKGLLAPVKGKTLLVSHPAYAYFCRDYDLYQMSLESEGKEPTPRTMTALIDKARALHIRTIFTQAQYGVKGAKLVAELLGARVVSLDPYSEDYLSSMKEIAGAFREGL